MEPLGNSMQPSQSASAAVADGSTGRLVVRNTIYLTVAQALTIPISIGINAAMARYLGAEEFGIIYFAATLAGLGFLAVEWGHHGALPALIARDRTRAGALLGTSLAWRAAASLFVYVVLAAGSYAFGYGREFQWAFALTFLGSVLTSCVAACKDTIRGFERTDIPAYVHVGQQLLTALLVLPVMALGGRMRAALLATAIATGIVLLLTWRTLRPAGVGTPTMDRGSARALAVEGTPFVLFGLAMVLQPNIDAFFLSKLAPAEVMGWYAASRKLIGVLLLPATALLGALYPTLCRLHGTDNHGFGEAVNGSLRAVALMVVPVAIGCAVYPEIGVSIFSRESFAEAEDNLRVSALFLALVYFTMPLGTALMAAGRQRMWAFVQSLCVVVSLVLDPLLVPLFQQHIGNGGLGLCVAGVISELVVLIFGLALMPKGVLDRRLASSVSKALLAGAAMAVFAFVARPVTPFAAAPAAVLVYVLALYFSGGSERQQLLSMANAVTSRLARFKGTPS